MGVRKGRAARVLAGGPEGPERVLGPSPGQLADPGPQDSASQSRVHTVWLGFPRLFGEVMTRKCSVAADLSGYSLVIGGLVPDTSVPHIPLHEF